MVLRAAQFDDGGDYGTPSIVFNYRDEETVVSPQTVRVAVQVPTYSTYTALVEDEEMRQFLQLIGYEGSLANLGKLKWFELTKE